MAWYLGTFNMPVPLYLKKIEKNLAFQLLAIVRKISRTLKAHPEGQLRHVFIAEQTLGDLNAIRQHELKVVAALLPPGGQAARDRRWHRLAGAGAGAARLRGQRGQLARQQVRQATVSFRSSTTTAAPFPFERRRVQHGVLLQPAGAHPPPRGLPVGNPPRPAAGRLHPCTSLPSSS